MKILVAVDDNLYSMYALGEAARLSANTWPDVTLLAVERDMDAPFDEVAPLEQRHPRAETLRNYRGEFRTILGDAAELYGPESTAGGFAAVARNVFEERTPGGRKELRLRLRAGNTTKAVLAEVREEQSDLVVLGCARSGCSWGSEGDVPAKVAEGADCSVLVIKEDRKPAKVTCILDHANVSQQSLEMINQLVTLYGVDLEIAGVLKHGELREEVERKMGEVLDYYIQRDVRALVKVVDASALGSFISLGSRTDLMALWLGPKSGLARFFSRDHVAELVNTALSSVLILR